MDRPRTHRTPRHVRPIAVVIAVLAAGAAAAVWTRGAGVPEVARQSLSIGLAERGDLIRELRASGQLIPRSPRIIAAAGAGQIERILAQVGTRVAADDVLLELSNPEYEERVREAESELHAALAARAELIAALHDERLAHKLEIGRLRLELERARFDLDAARGLGPTSALSEAEFRTVEMRHRQLALRLDLERERGRELPALHAAREDAAGARVQHLESRVEFMRRRRDELIVHAGADGIVQDLPVEVGQRVAAGELLARIADPDDLEIELRIPERQAGDVRPGLPVRIDLRSATAAAEITRIDPAVSGGLVRVEARLTEALPEGARMGQSVEAAIELESVLDAVHIERPAAAQSGSRVQLFVINGDIAERRSVRLGRSSVSRVEVLEGLAPGERAVLSDMSAYEDIDQLRLN